LISFFPVRSSFSLPVIGCFEEVELVRVAAHQLHKRGREEGMKKREKGYVCPLNILAQMFYFVNGDFAIQ
jgi:hypothetical protein